MSDHQQKTATRRSDNISLSQGQPLYLSKNKDFSQLEAETLAYLQTDRQNLREFAEHARHAGDTAQARSLMYRWKYYYRVENFFLYLVEQQHSTQLAKVTSEQIEAFIKRERHVKRKGTPPGKKSTSLGQIRDKIELSAFFKRALANGVITHKPFIPRNKITQNKDFSQLEAETLAYLQTDRQNLQEFAEHARHAGDTAQARSLMYRWRYYYCIENFFLYLLEHQYPTQLTKITTEQIEVFIERERPVKHRGNVREISSGKKNTSVGKQRDRVELSAFFNRALANGAISHNPFIALSKAAHLLRLEPKNPSPQTQADLLAFQEYLQRRVKSRLLTPGTVALSYRHIRTLMHDAEIYHAHNPEWPTELDGLFADPKWIAEWLTNLENRSVHTSSNELTRGSVSRYLGSVRRIWLFLKSEGRATKTYYNELKELFRVEDSSFLLPGRKPKIIGSLSEAEIAAVFDVIERYSINPILKLRDLALFITGIETTMRMESLHSMRLENFIELEPGIFVCRVRAKDSTQKRGSGMKNFTEKDTRWREWYISPHAHVAINIYLEATGRNWESQGPVWLTIKGQPLSFNAQKIAIRGWLRLAKCKFIRPHVLRHTGIDRLINKFNLPVSIVQAVSHHADADTLLNIYARRNRTDAFKDINQLFPIEPENAAKYEAPLLAISTKLNELSADIGRQSQQKHIFSRADVEEMLESLGDQIARLTKCLGFDTLSNEVLITKEEYLLIDAKLRSLGLSYQKVLGFEPTVQQQTLIKATKRTRKSLLGS